jgi:superfamily I DNA/RNA helicase
MRNKVLDEVKARGQNAQQKKIPSSPEVQLESGQPRIKMTSFEGAKGLSAQHVFIVGIHKDELPHDEAQIQDIEICRFVVGLTRTKKKCSLLCTNRFADQWKQPSVFLSWIKSERYEITKVDANYWR